MIPVLCCMALQKQDWEHILSVNINLLDASPMVFLNFINICKEFSISALFFYNTSLKCNKHVCINVCIDHGDEKSSTGVRIMNFHLLKPSINQIIAQIKQTRKLYPLFYETVNGCINMHCFIICHNSMVLLLVLYSLPSIEAVSCFICSRRRVIVAQYRLICLVGWLFLRIHVASAIFQPNHDIEVGDNQSLKS